MGSGQGEAALRNMTSESGIGDAPDAALPSPRASVAAARSTLRPRRTVSLMAGWVRACGVCAYLWRGMCVLTLVVTLFTAFGMQRASRSFDGSGMLSDMSSAPLPPMELPVELPSPRSGRRSHPLTPSATVPVPLELGGSLEHGVVIGGAEAETHHLEAVQEGGSTAESSTGSTAAARAAAYAHGFSAFGLYTHPPNANAATPQASGSAARVLGASPAPVTPARPRAASTHEHPPPSAASAAAASEVTPGTVVVVHSGANSPISMPSASPGPRTAAWQARHSRTPTAGAAAHLQSEAEAAGLPPSPPAPVLGSQPSEAPAQQHHSGSLPLPADAPKAAAGDAAAVKSYTVWSENPAYLRGSGQSTVSSTSELPTRRNPSEIRPSHEARVTAAQLGTPLSDTPEVDSVDEAGSAQPSARTLSLHGDGSGAGAVGHHQPPLAHAGTPAAAAAMARAPSRIGSLPRASRYSSAAVSPEGSELEHSSGMHGGSRASSSSVIVPGGPRGGYPLPSPSSQPLSTAAASVLSRSGTLTRSATLRRRSGVSAHSVRMVPRGAKVGSADFDPFRRMSTASHSSGGGLVLRPGGLSAAGSASSRQLGRRTTWQAGSFNDMLQSGGAEEALAGGDSADRPRRLSLGTSGSMRRQQVQGGSRNQLPAIREALTPMHSIDAENLAARASISGGGGAAAGGGAMALTPRPFATTSAAAASDTVGIDVFVTKHMSMMQRHGVGRGAGLDILSTGSESSLTAAARSPAQPVPLAGNSSRRSKLAARISERFSSAPRPRMHLQRRSSTLDRGSITQGGAQRQSSSELQVSVLSGRFSKRTSSQPSYRQLRSPNDEPKSPRAGQGALQMAKSAIQAVPRLPSLTRKVGAHIVDSGTDVVSKVGGAIGRGGQTVRTGRLYALWCDAPTV